MVNTQITPLSSLSDDEITLIELGSNPDSLDQDIWSKLEKARNH